MSPLALGALGTLALLGFFSRLVALRMQGRRLPLPVAGAFWAGAAALAGLDIASIRGGADALEGAVLLLLLKLGASALVAGLTR